MKRIWGFRIAVLLGIIGIVGMAGLAYGVGSVTVYNADGSFNCATDTIQWGINACLDGGTVACADGVYTGTENKNLSWNGKHITVRSQNRATNCIIDCQYDGREFYFNNTGQDSRDLIQGFTIRNGYVAGVWPADRGGGIYCYNNSS
ncbi:hypothetical protein KJ640_01335, partial [bacterium]|nr:hypothetical protein [bacterium]